MTRLIYHRDDLSAIKREALIFDKIHLVEAYQDFVLRTFEQTKRAELEYLQECGIVGTPFHPLPSTWDGSEDRGSRPLTPPRRSTLPSSEFTPSKKLELAIMVEQIALRLWSERIARASGIETVPVFMSAPAFRILDKSLKTSNETVVNVALAAFPTPDESNSWEEIVAFKTEEHQKQWSFRRFLYALATKQQSEAEIRDDLEWTLNEYRRAMELHHIKASQSFVELFLIPTVEIIEDLVKFNWSKIAKGALSVKERKIELMEAEMKAPGREFAYVFEARKRFTNPVG